MELYLTSFSKIILLGGSFIFACIIIYFGWSLVFYATSTGNDLERAHAKGGLINSTIMAFFAMVIWWLCAVVAKQLGI